MSSARKLSDIPPCMRLSFIYPWESSPEREIGDPLSYDLPDITSDFEAIYGEGAANNFFSSTLTEGDNAFPALQDDSPCADDFLDSFGPEPTPEPPSETVSSPVSSFDYASDPSSLSCVSSSPSPKHGTPGGKKGHQTTISNARALYLPYQRRVLDSPVSPPSLSSSTSSSVSSNPDPDDVLTPEFMRSLQFRRPGTPRAGLSSLHDNHDPVPYPRRHSKSSVKSRPSPPRPPQNVTVYPSQQMEVFAHRYCRYKGCTLRFSDKRTTERHRLTHLRFGTYVCPNPACESRTKLRPHFASDFTLGRHLRLAASDSPCAVGKGQKLSLFKLNAAQVEGLIQQALDPFNPAIHTPF